VGTSALRRRAQLLAARPDLEVRELRGNVDTRLAKRDAGEVDVLVLAAAGLDRLGRRREAGGTLHDPLFVPAPGQGIIAVQARAGSAAGDVAASASHAATMARLRAERAVVRELAASCHTPVGIHADSVTIRGFAGLPDGSRWVLDEVAIEDDPEAAAAELARRMLAAGAADVLRDAEAMAAR
jgi:hydroxymethylbilane synthase